MAACSRCTKPSSPASSRQRSRPTAPSRRTGSCSTESHTCGSTAAKTSCVGGCQDHRRLPARSASGVSAGGRTGRTVNRRIARIEDGSPICLDRSNFSAGRLRWLRCGGASTATSRETDALDTRRAEWSRGSGLERAARTSTTGACDGGLHRHPATRKGGRMVGRIPILHVMPVVDLGRQAAKATVGEPMPVSATVFREGHDKLGAEVVATDPAAPDALRSPCVKHPERPDHYEAFVVARRRGRLDLRGAGLVRPASAPGSTPPGLKIPAGVDVELMFTEGRLLFEKVKRRASPRPTTRRSSRAPSPPPRTPSARSRRAWRRCSPPS